VFSFWALPRTDFLARLRSLTWPREAPKSGLRLAIVSLFRSDVIHVQIRGYRICSIGYRLSRYRNHPSRSNARQLRRPRGACRVPCVPCGAEFVSYMCCQPAVRSLPIPSSQCPVPVLRATRSAKQGEARLEWTHAHTVTRRTYNNSPAASIMTRFSETGADLVPATLTASMRRTMSRPLVTSPKAS
jgi:hypothetical protein